MKFRPFWLFKVVVKLNQSAIKIFIINGSMFASGKNMMYLTNIGQ